MQVKV
jgi:exosome complex RNA-binding protein Rrp42 (RNase PH superfamily)